jgi:hypothetical protein
MHHKHFEHAEKVHQALGKVTPALPEDHIAEQAKAAIAAEFPELDAEAVAILASKHYAFVPGHWEVVQPVADEPDAALQSVQSSTSILD